MATVEVKAYNVYGQERGEGVLFCLERLERDDSEKQDNWHNCGAFETPRKVAREIVQSLSRGGLKIDFYKFEIPSITNASPKISKRDYGVIPGRFHLFKFEKPTVIRALSYEEFKQVYEELDSLRESAKELHGLVRKLTEKDGKIDPAYLQRVMWEEQLSSGNYQ